MKFFTTQATPNKRDENDQGEKPEVRLVIESHQRGWLQGWAAASPNDPGELQLVLAGQPQLAALWVRHPRADVRVALGSTEGGRDDYGFICRLPASLAQQIGKGLRLSVAGVEFDLPVGDTLDAWVDALQQMPSGDAREQDLRWLIHHVAASGGAEAALTPERADWLSAQVRARALTPWLNQASAEVQAVPIMRGQVEGLQGLTLSGWAHVDGPAGDNLRLMGPAGELTAGVIRIHREDVRAALGVSQSMLGFEIELPISLWDHVDAEGRCQFSVEAGWRSLPGGRFSVDRRQLALHVEQLANLSVEALSTPDQQYQVILALEHVAAANGWRELTPSARSFLSRQASRFGLQTLLPAEGTDAAASFAGLRRASGHDVLLWRLLRAFSEGLAQPDASPQACLNDVLERFSVQGELRETFLQALIPVFSSRRRYGQLRPMLAMGALRRTHASPNAFSVSLLLPELVATADLDAAIQTLSLLAGGLPGWLNTECVAQAAQILLDDTERVANQPPQATAVVQQFLALLSKVGEDPWGRLHDAHLIDAQVSLLLLDGWLPSAALFQVQRSAVRLFGAVPGFWNALSQRWPTGRPWPGPLSQAHAAWRRLERGLRADLSAGDAMVLWSSLAPLWAADNVDVHRMAREILLTAMPQMTQARVDERDALMDACAGLAPSEKLRLLAHPLWDVGAAPLAGLDVRDVIRHVSNEWTNEAQDHQILVIQQLRSASGDAAAALPSLVDCRRLAGARHDFVGVSLAAVRWALGRTRWPAAQVQSELAELRGWWVTAAAMPRDGAPLPSPLCDAFTLLSGFAGADALLASVLDEWRSHLQTHEQVALTLPEEVDLLLPAPGPLHRTLVAVYSCRANLASRVCHIRETWGRDLTDLGVPWVVVVGDGQDALEAEGILGLRVSDQYEDLPAKSLALFDWAWRHTDFDHVYKIDDDCHLAVRSFFDQSPHLAPHYLGRVLWRAEGGTDRVWHQAKSKGMLAARSVDKSPEPSRYADGGTGYLLSRLAMGQLRRTLRTSAGARLTRSAFMEDKLIGDLLKLGGIELRDNGYFTLSRRKHGSDPVPVNSWQNTFYPGEQSPTLLTHLDDASALPAVQVAAAGPGLWPKRLWPTESVPALKGSAVQLELVSPPEGVARLSEAALIVIAVARNERVMMPHFLAHYRGLGVQHFVLIDNLSDDGTRSYLLAQPDVVLYSSDAEYRLSQYGVAWQQAVLAAHGVGRWSVLADIDELLVYQDCETVPLQEWLAAQSAAGFDGIKGVMVDMYPRGPLAEADFTQQTPFEAAPYFDQAPLIPWRLGSGWYSNGASCVSALRHRLIPDSAPNQYTSQKLIALRYMPWVRLSQGLHCASGVRAVEPGAWLAHFKYHAGFARKIEEEVARKQHFNDAEEYLKYRALIAEASGSLFDPERSVRYAGSQSFASVCISGVGNRREAGADRSSS